MQAESLSPVEVRAGQMVLLPRNDPHLLASAAGLPPADPAPIVQQVKGGLKRMTSENSWASPSAGCLGRSGL